MTTRGHRVGLVATKDYIFFSTKDNLYARSRHNKFYSSVIFTENMARITCVSPCNDGTRVAIGDEKGKVSLLKLAGGKFEIVKEHMMCNGVVNEILWSPDNKFIVAVGDKASCLNPETGGRGGDVTGHTGLVLCGALTDQKVLFTAGESNEILRHEGIPFKGNGTRVSHPHTGFVNQLRLSPDGNFFVTVSLDKSICIFDTKTSELKHHINGAHEMGIYDVAWIDNENFVTVSADNSAKYWHMAE